MLFSTILAKYMQYDVRILGQNHSPASVKKIDGLAFLWESVNYN